MDIASVGAKMGEIGQLIGAKEKKNLPAAYHLKVDAPFQNLEFAGRLQKIKKMYKERLLCILDPAKPVKFGITCSKGGNGKHRIITKAVCS